MMRPGMWVLSGLSLGLLAVLAVELAPAADRPEPARARAVVPVRPKPAAVHDEPVADWIATALARPLPSPTRRPAAANPVPAQDAGGALRLTGIMIGPTGRRAMFVAEQGGKPLVVEEGATVQTYRVERIEAGGVSLSGPDGGRMLRPSFAGRAAALPVAPPNTGAPPENDLPPGILPMDLAPAAPGRPRP